MNLVLLPPSHNIRMFLTLVLWDGGSSRFQYELLVHTPNTDVYRHILECRFTHFAPYVVHIETDVIVRTLPRPRARWLAGRGENFTSTPSVYSSSLLPWLERLSYCLEYICPLVLPPFTYTRPL